MCNAVGAMAVLSLFLMILSAGLRPQQRPCREAEGSMPSAACPSKHPEFSVSTYKIARHARPQAAPSTALLDCLSK